jgi:hypothetical protein
MKRLGVAIGAIFLVYSAHAENIFLEESLRPVPHRTAIAPKPSVFAFITAALPSALPIDVDALANELKSQFKTYITISQQPAPACGDVKAADYVLSLHVAGRFDDCANFASSCVSQETSPRVIARGAACRATRFQFDQADQLYQAATDAKYSNSPDYGDIVYNYAEFSMFWIHPEKVLAILGLNKIWTSAEVTLFEALIKRVGKLDLGAITKTQVDAFLEQQIAKSSGVTLGHLKMLRVNIADGDYRYVDAMKFLSQDAPSMQNPLLWYDTAYRDIYFGMNDQFAEARKIYDVSDLYTNLYSTLPTEQNTYNYTEIYGSVCTGHVMSGKEQTQFESFKSQIRSGAITSQQALAQAGDFAKKYSDRADVLTTYGGLLALSGQHAQAMQSYWQAHRLCRYYNRANWGLVLEKRYFKFTSFPDYDSNAQKVERELGSRQIPQQIATYISDWNALDATTQRRVEYGMRIWLPWIPALQANGYSTYIKFSFDLLSDSPGGSDLRDQRIGGEGYPNDNRLWDDVRGAGGDTVMADASEVFQTVQGDYNLLGHEMTHQFQGLLESKFQPGLQCVQQIYDHAKVINNFPDGYSSQNKEEHFAQGVTYYLVPADSPKRFGLNQTWLVEHNQEQLAFVKSIEAAAGTLEKITCTQPQMNLADF